MPRASLLAHHAEHADQPGEAELGGQRGRQRAGAVRVVRGVDEHGRALAAPAASRSSRPGEAHRGERRAHRVGVDRLLSARPRSAPRPRPAPARRWPPGARRAAAGRCRRPAAEAAQREPLPADRDLAGSATPNSAPYRATCASTSTQRSSSTCGHRRVLLGQHRHRARLDDPGLLPGDAQHVGAQVLGVVEPDRGDHRDRAVGDVGGVPPAAQPDLDHRRPRPGASANAAKPIAVSTSNLDSAPWLGVDQLDERRHVAVELDVALRA